MHHHAQIEPASKINGLIVAPVLQSDSGKWHLAFRWTTPQEIHPMKITLNVVVDPAVQTGTKGGKFLKLSGLTQRWGKEVLEVNLPDGKKGFIALGAGKIYLEKTEEEGGKPAPAPVKQVVKEGQPTPDFAAMIQQAVAQAVAAAMAPKAETEIKPSPSKKERKLSI